MPQYYQEIMEWLKFLPVKLKYTGSGLSNIAGQVLLLLVKHCRQREYLTGEDKAELLEKYDFSCAACGMKTNDLEFDHIQALQNIAPGTKQVFQPLCSACHQLKTLTDPKSLSLDFPRRR